MSTSSVSSSSSASSSTISTNLSTSTRARVNGTSLVSGLDTDSLIKQLTATTRSKIAKQQQKMQTAQWKRDAYRDVITKMTDFSKKYFSYSNSSTNILSSKFFDVATITNPSSLLTVSGSASAAENMQVGSISQLARQASFTSTKKVASEAIQSGAIKENWVQSSVQAQSLNLSLGSKSYSLSIPQNIILDPAVTDSDKMAAMQNALQTQIDSNADLKGKLTVGLTGDGTSGSPFQFSLTNSDTANALKITGGTLATSLGFSKDSTGTAITGSTLDSTAVGKLFASKTLGDALAGSSLTFTLNGINKTVSFNLTDKSQYSTVSDMRTYIQNALDTSYGSGKITVGHLGTDDMNFTTTDTTSVLSVTSSDNTNVLNEVGGAIKIGAGESNRLETSKTLKQLATEITGTKEIPGLTADADGNYKIKINNKEFTFSQDTALSSALSQINNDNDANVTVTYSSITNTFNVKADSSGASSTVNISDVSGNLASSLFGTARTTAIQSNSAITMDSTALPAALSGSTIKFTLNGQQKDITFTAGEEAQYSTAADVSTYLQAKFDSAFGAGNVTVSNNSGILKFAIADTTSAISIDSSTPSTALDALNITAGSSNGNYVIKDGQDAKLKVSFDGGNTFTDIVRTENTFTLDGVNFSLLGTTDQTKSLADTTIKFTSNSNVDALYTKINDFVTAYNDVVNLINGYVSDSKSKDPSYDPLSDEQKAQMTDTQITDWNKNAKKGILQNDSTLAQVSSEMRTVMTSLVSGSNLKALSKIGIATSSYDYDTATNGKLIVDETALKKALTENAEDVADLFTNSTNGISTKLKAVLDENVGTFGGDGTLINLAGTANTLADQSILSKNIESYTAKIKELKTKLSDEQEKYWAKFTAMETQLSNLQSQSDWLYAQSSGS